MTFKIKVVNIVINLKMILSHLLIFFISIFGLAQFFDYTGNGFITIYSIFHFLTVLVLYFLSGYYFTNKFKKFSIFNYAIIALIGIFLWSLAYFDSPNDLDWKNGQGGIWFFYRIYISGIEVPFNFNDSFSFWTKNIKVEMIQLLTLSIIPSITQAIGGYIKTRLK